ncbi:MAG: methylmalonyl Co-A mutase-associated GTPase MeaB [Bacteroidetes bacterium]|nr:methylmalonyl Co-A mutase-associated GTPase MeaB [Bacteroidota bacterium]
MALSKNPDKKQINRLVELNKKHHAARDPKKIFEGLRKGEKTALAEAITLCESARADDQQSARQLLQHCLPHTGKSLRIGITGVPGVGKSTFIESFGQYLVKQGKKIAVLAVDPSSEKTGGSILGDKTRMVNLSVNPGAFIRPTSSRGSLGGVAQRTRESILLCEAAGYDVILIETVGVGQSETAVHSMTDFFLLLMLAGAGDELQGIKRGIMEMADALVITKADGDNTKNATRAKSLYKNALHLFPANENNWIPQVDVVSAAENKGIEKVWETICSYENLTKTNGHFQKKRKNQQEYWMHEALKEQLLHEFYNNPAITKQIKQLTKKLAGNEITSYDAARLLIELYQHGKKNI